MVTYFSRVSLTLPQSLSALAVSAWPVWVVAFTNAHVSTCLVPVAYLLPFLSLCWVVRCPGGPPALSIQLCPIL